jgi:hypothetical protein
MAAVAIAAGTLLLVVTAALNHLLASAGLPGLGSSLRRELAAIAALTAAVVVASRGLRPSADTAAWGRGAEGERRIGEALSPLADEGWVLLHDRARRGSPANIDHIVVGPGGLWMVETKRWRGKLEAGPHRLRLNGRPVDHVYDQLWRQADVVTRAAGDILPRLGLQARPVLCVEGTTLVRLPDRWGHRVHGPVEIHDTSTLIRRLRVAPRVLSPEDVSALSRALDQALPPA